MRGVIYALAALGGAYLLLCGAARLAYPRALFPAPRLARAPALADGAELVELPHADGSKTVALSYPAPPGARTIVVFHGNGETMFDGVGLAAELRRRGLGALLVEYRGYGITHGPPPTEASLYEDAEAALGWLARAGVPSERIALFGWSLGSGVAAEMASRGRGARLVLLSPFTSVVDMGWRFAPFLPVSWLMTHRLDTLSKAGEIPQGTLVVHGDADELIPFAMGEAVARAIPDARLVRVPGGRHADLLFVGRAGRPTASEVLDAIADHAAR